MEIKIELIGIKIQYVGRKNDVTFIKITTHVMCRLSEKTEINSKKPKSEVGECGKCVAEENLGVNSQQAKRAVLSDKLFLAYFVCIQLCGELITRWFSKS